MREVNLNFEVLCQRPIWATLGSFKEKFSKSRYRVYVNNDLITERDWNWDNSIFLLESVWINGERDTNYTLRLDPVVHIPEQANFSINNFKVTNLEADSTKIDDLQVNFILR